MQATQEKLTALQKRVIAAQNALKLADKLGPKIAVKEAEIKAIEDSISSCPEGQTKNGLTKRVETLKTSVCKLAKERYDAEKTAANAVDLSCPFVAEITAEIGTEGGESV